MQFADPADFTQERATELEAVVDLRRGAHIQQRALHRGILGLDVEAANQIGLVLLGRHPARSAARCTALTERKHTGTLWVRCEKCVSVQAHKQVCLHAACLLHPHLQRYKKVGVARQVGAHGVAVDAGGVDALAHQVGQAQHHVFFARAARSDGAGVFATVSGVQRNDDQPVCRCSSRNLGFGHRL